MGYHWNRVVVTVNLSSVFRPFRPHPVPGNPSKRVATAPENELFWNKMNHGIYGYHRNRVVVPVNFFSVFRPFRPHLVPGNPGKRVATAPENELFWNEMNHGMWVIIGIGSLCTSIFFSVSLFRPHLVPGNPGKRVVTAPENELFWNKMNHVLYLAMLAL